MKHRMLALLLTAVILVSLIPAAAAETATKLVALTFDDGPGPYTARLLDGLAEYHAKATFFCLGSRVEQYPETVKRIVEEGHQLANHSYGHPNLNELSTESALYQFSRTDDLMNEVTGASETYFCRAPYGNTNEALRSMMQAPLISWSVDTLDWQVRNANKVRDNILRETFDGAIVLLHDIHSFSVDGVLQALDTLESRGYEFVTVKELMRRRGVTPQNGEVYYSCRPGTAEAAPLHKPELSVTGTGEALKVTLFSDADAPIYYTLDDTPVGYNSARYEAPFTVNLPCTIRAIAAWDVNGIRSEELVVSYTLPPAGEPGVTSDKNGVYFTPANQNESVFYVLDDGTEQKADGAVRLPGTTWFSYYADGEGLTPTEAKRFLYTEEGNLFSDVDPAQWYYSALDCAAAKGWMQGSGDGKMRPNQTVSRGMLATLLWRIEGSPKPIAEAAFADVAVDAYYVQAVSWCCEVGIFSGLGNEIFAPEQPITRQQLAKVLMEWLDLEISEASTDQILFADMEAVADWASEAVVQVCALGIMQGSGGSFHPGSTANRAQIAAVLVRAEDWK